MQDDLAQRTRALIDRILLQPRRPKDPDAVFLELKHHADSEGWTYDHGAALEYWWDLARMGAIAVLGAGPTGYFNNQPSFIVTELGRKLLSEPGASPRDKTRYMTLLRQRVPNPDAIVLAYIDEAIGAWQTAIYRACVVMTGCACERLMILLAEAVATTQLDPYATDLRKALASPKPSGISWIFDKVRGAMKSAADAKMVPGDLADAHERKLSPIFERARMLRNDAGHPTGERVTAEDAETGLLLFPEFCELATGWVDALRAPTAASP